VAGSTIPDWQAKLPNALTIARLVAIAPFVVVLALADGSHSWLAGSLFGAAAITDQIDGWLARRWRVESRFGQFADPLADRLLIDAAVIVLFVDRRVHWAALAIIVLRDVVMIAGARLAVPRGYEFSVSTLGKLATWILYLGVAMTMVTPRATGWPNDLVWAGIGLALAAAALYGLSAQRQLRPAS
jgi:CDP-diacylglycerol--glycerol-3-phosphate 3-phosphatidyltransferase